MREPGGTLAAMTTHPTPVVVLDMATLRFRTRASGGPVQLTTRTGQVLAVVHPRRGEARRSVAFRALDAALAEARLPLPTGGPRGTRYARLALYNPFTGDVSYDPVPGTVTFTSGAPVPLDADGTIGLLHGGERPDVLEVSGYTLVATERDVSELTRVIAAQSA